jgi:DNA-3-methyladenine glycosylase II
MTLKLSPAFQKSLFEACRNDAVLKKAVGELGPPDRWEGAPEFATLLKIITDQQLSVHAAAAIWRRVQDLGATEPESFLAHSEEELRQTGLSRSKIRYGHALASALIEGTLDLASLTKMKEEEAITALTRIPGIGRWTAEIYLLYALQHPDIFPAGDLVLQKAIQRLYGFEARPSEKQSREIAEKWRPGRSPVALFLWRVYEAP